MTHVFITIILTRLTCIHNGWKIDDEFNSNYYYIIDIPSGLTFGIQFVCSENYIVFKTF